MAEILIVDDDESVRQVIARMLAPRDHTIRQAGDGKAAFVQLRERAADLIISDIYMPEMDGLETLIRVRQEFPATKLIVISGGGYISAENVLEMATHLGAAASFIKPISAQALLDAVDAALA